MSPPPRAARECETGWRRILRDRTARWIAVAAGAGGLAALLVLLALPAHSSPSGADARTDSAPALHAGRRHTHRTRTHASRSRALSARLTILTGARRLTVPRAFFGLSTEYWALPLYERSPALFARALALLHASGDGPLVLRIGGDSADHSFWDPNLRILPPWVFPLTPVWLRQTGEIVRHGGIRLLLDLNLVTDSAPSAARWVRAAEVGLPRRSIVGFEVGNEPDIYSHWFWRAITARTRLVTSQLPSRMSARSYTRDFLSYSRMLARVAPRVPVVGPALANPALDVGWIRRLLAGPHPGLGVISAHRYPYSACAAPPSPSFPTIARVLSENASAGTARAVVPAVRLAHRAGLPFRLTELNSVTCGGRAGVSNTFSTALWAPDTLFELLRAHVDGVNVHIRATSTNAPFILGRNGMDVRPLLYGLILFARTLGPDSQLVPLKLHAGTDEHVKAWAVSVRGDVLHVLLIDKGNHPVSVRLLIPGRGPATVERLLAPSAGARFGEQLNGQHLGTDGRWHGVPAHETIRPDPGGYRLTLPPTSAALLGLPPAT